MQFGMQKHWSTGGVTFAALLLAGCASQPAVQTTASSTPAPVTAPAPAAAPVVATKPMATQPVSAPVMYFAVLPEDERYYLFGDVKTYFQYLEHGEVALTRSRIGASPKQTTVVFGLTNDDAKSGKPTAAEMLFDGKAAATSPFYGEIFKDGRYYVFNEFADMKMYLESGEAAYTVTDIGTGPKGATQVYVLNQDSFKKGRPLETIAMFSTVRASK